MLHKAIFLVPIFHAICIVWSQNRPLGDGKEIGYDNLNSTTWKETNQKTDMISQKLTGINQNY